MSRCFEVYSEGYVVWNQDNQEVYCGRIYLKEYAHEDAAGEIITTDLIIDKWGGQRIKLDQSIWDEEFINGVVVHVTTESLSEAEAVYHSIAQLDTAPIDVKELID